jgi:hypothetical protein
MCYAVNLFADWTLHDVITIIPDHGQGFIPYNQ